MLEGSGAWEKKAIDEGYAVLRPGHPGLRKRWSWWASLQRYLELGEGVFREREVNFKQRGETVQRLECDSCM